MEKISFLPTNRNEMRERGWEACDVIFVTADAYCDHPSFGVALLSRFLESEGHRVGIIAAPDYRKDGDFLKLGAPRLFFGVTAGNLDSMLNIYTSFLNIRKSDKYAAGGLAGLRPKLPTIVYTNKLRQLFDKTPVIIGGIEASMRRLGHYDFWSDKVKRSILFDAKADMLIYGMAERQISEVANRLKAGEAIGSMNNIRGTVIARKEISFLDAPVILSSFQEIVSDKHAFLEAFKRASREMNPFSAKSVVQKTDTRYCVHLPPALPLSEKEMDRLYALKYTRRCHPSYDKFGGVPALKTVETSIVSHRGCSASCSFCSLSLHQGRVIQSRSLESIIKEAEEIAGRSDFKGVISDVGGPTANMYAAACGVKNKCGKTDCLWPEVCQNFVSDFDKQIRMLESVRAVKGVKQVNVQSGLRYDLLLNLKAKKYFKELCRHFVSGQMKVAPEHASDRVLYLMRKPPHKVYKKFIEAYRQINKELGKDQYLVQYFITAHPGCGEEEAGELAKFVQELGCAPEQIQDFIPLPMTASNCMYHTGLDLETGRPLYVAKKKSERMQQRRILQRHRKLS